MSNQYYLMAQLPAFSVSDDNKAALPITEEYFTDLCQRFLNEKELNVLKELSLEPKKEGVKTGSVLVDAWNENERQLRYALGQIRALKMKKKFDTSSVTIGQDIVQIARTAVGMESPLAAERYLNEYRLSVIEKLRPMDYFCADAVFYYGLKLKLTARMKKFDAEKGMSSYHKIYDSILEGDK